MNNLYSPILVFDHFSNTSPQKMGSLFVDSLRGEESRSLLVKKDENHENYWAAIICWAFLMKHVWEDFVFHSLIKAHSLQMILFSLCPRGSLYVL